jgi:hypothetical protein
MERCSLGAGGYGNAGLWRSVSRTGNIMDRMVIKEARPRWDRWCDPVYDLPLLLLLFQHILTPDTNLQAMERSDSARNPYTSAR